MKKNLLKKQVQKLTSANVVKNFNDTSTANKIAIGAAGIAIAAGAVAAGAALSDKKNRSKLSKSAMGAFDIASDLAKSYGEKGQIGSSAIGHKIAQVKNAGEAYIRGKGKTKKKK